MTEYDFWRKYEEYLIELNSNNPGSVLFMEYCNNEGRVSRFPITDAERSTRYPGCFEATCRSNFYYDDFRDELETTSRRTFSYRNVQKLIY